ncbi:MAG: DUF6600 domain-containing protein [Thermodesulfobacteriota bacterium]
MERMGKLLSLPFILLLVMIPITSPQGHPRSEDAEGEETILVGHISHVEGEVLRYVPEEEDWVATVKDAPFGVNDAIYSDRGGRAEIMMPNNTWTRIDGDTRIQLIALRDDVTEIDVESGVARFYNKGSDAVIRARTTFGYVMAPGDTTFDLDVGDDSVEVVALKGTVYFTHSTSETEFEVIAGSSSILADSRQVTAGEAHTDPYWHSWNRKRDTLWAKRMRVKGKSVRYLPPRLHHEAYVLEEHGRWERVYYHGEYHYFWRPLYVSVGWAPFTVGRWVVWYGDHTWIPHEPFGYVTHHYGNWVLVGGFWYWVPPVSYVRVHIGRPFVHIGFAWYPGRVAWIHFGAHVGWVPLAPWEPYYCHHHWGPRVVTVKNVNVTKINVNIHRYKHFKHAVIIDKRHLYNVKSYRKFRIRNINSTATLRNYRAVPVVNHRVIKDYGNIKEKYTVTNLDETRNPQRMVIKKNRENESAAKRHGEVRSKRVRENGKDMERGRIGKGAPMRPQEGKDRVVPVNEARRPVSRVKSEEREPKRETTLDGKNRKQGNGEVQKRWGRIPPKPLTSRTGRRENQGQARREGQKVWRKMDAKPVTGQEVQQQEQRFTRSEVRKGGERIPLRTEQQFQKRPEGREETQGRRLRRWHPGQQQQQTQRRQYSGREYSPRLPNRPGAPSAQSRVGPVKNWTRTKNGEVL